MKIAFGLAFDVEKTKTMRSGFAPALVDLGAKKELFGSLRLEGFAALLRLEFADQLIVIGGNEGRYKGEEPTINRAWAICEMLLKDLGIEEDRVRHIPSNSNTGGNVAIIRETITASGSHQDSCFVVSNHYHLPRVKTDLEAANLAVPCYPAEAFLLMENPKNKDRIIDRLGGGPLAERMAEEIQGIAHKLQGTYQARTNEAPK